jgi:Motility related/secretion protein
MLQTLKLFSASLLLAFPGLPNWTGFHNPLHHRPPAAVDSLPPAWKPASRLALEDQFVLGRLPNLQPQPIGLKLAQDPRQLRVSLDPETGRVRYGVEFGDVTLGQPVSVPLIDLSHEITALTFERIWQATSHDKINTMAGHTDASSAAHTGLSFAFPSPLPRQVQSLLGPGGPALNVSGSEQIRLSGTSNWTNQQIGILGQHRSLFPSLDMQQDLNIVLEGQLSDRVRVNLLQNSAVQIPLANRIAINYKGDEDDLIQELDLGNTNLTLPGTQYVSYSGRNEGLFGAKVAARAGPLDLTLLASKQEGRSERASFAGGSQQQSQEIADLDYVRGVYYFLYDPSGMNGDLNNPDPGGPYVYELQAPNQASIQLFLDDGVYANTLYLSRGRAWLDPRQANLNRADTAQVAVRGNFRALKQGDDYDILPGVYGPNYPVIRLKRPLLGDSQTLAALYTYQRVATNGQALPGDANKVSVGDTITVDADGQKTFNLKLLRAPQAQLLVDPNTGSYLPDTSFNATRELELKNFYQLGGQRIAQSTFQMAIRHGDFQPYAISENVAGAPVPYIEVLGLDNYDESNGYTSTHGHDGKVDGTPITTNSRVFVNFEDGTLFFPDLRPFAPRLGANGRAFEQLISARTLFRRDSLVGPADSSNEANPAVYDKRTVLRQDRRYTIMVTFTASQVGGEIPLGRTNIIEGSEVVTINGQPLVRDRDYKIDYDLGKITLIRQLGPSDNLNVDYGYAPLFQQAGRTLLGSAFSWQGLDSHIGGAFMYESRGASELRPRIGEEPSRSMVGDLNGEWHAHPAFVTRLVDALPGVRTTAPSEFNISAEVGLSIPNPNTANVVYIDDMESVRDAVTLSMSPERWVHSSIPFRTGTIPVDDPGLPNTRKNTEIHWYSPVNAIKERDLNPSLSDGQGAQNAHQSLAISLPKRPDPKAPGAVASPSDSLWAGLTYVLDPVGLDLSRAQFIEFQVNDFRDYYPDSAGVGRIRGRHVKVHIDIGTVSEDQQRAPNIPPNGRLDTEDQPPFDNQLSVTDSKNEDTGLDGYLNTPIKDRPGEVEFAATHHDSVLTLAGPVPRPDLVTVDSLADPAGDDFHPPDNTFNDYDPRKWLFTNGTEDDHTIVPVPETEDLNGNTLLDTSNNYFEYTIDLGADTPYLIDEAYTPGRNFANDGKAVLPDNGWRHYRIPISDVLRQTFGAPDLTLARHVRVWLDGVSETDPKPPLPGLGANEGRPYIVIGELSIVGSRWFISDLDSVAAAAKTNVTLSSVNSLDNADIYTAPFDPGRTVNGSQGVNRREQSIALTFQNLLPSDSIEVYRTFSLDEDYSRYGTLAWYATGDSVQGYNPASGSLQYFVRFASDEIGTSYYEYRAPLPLAPGRAVNWQDVRLKLTDLSNLKLDPKFPNNLTDIYYKVPGKDPGSTFIIKGRPSFTRLRRISFGLVNTGTAAIPAGSMWLDEMRATDIQKATDHAQRITLNGKMANLLTYNFNYNGRGPDFQSVGEVRGTGNNQSQMNLGLNMDLNRFFEGTGIILPVGYSYSGSKSTPRFTAGDDVIRTGAAAEASVSKFASSTWSASYSRAWSDRSNPFLRFTLGGLGASITRTVTTNVNPSIADTSTATAAGVTYLISPRSLLPLPIPLTKSKLYLLPERIFWNYTLGLSEDRNWSRLADANGTLLPATFNKGRTAFIDFGASFRPVDIFHEEFQARRNLTLPDALREQWGFINLGKVVQWRQAWDTRYAFQRTPMFFRPTFSWNASYQQANGLELSPDLSVRNVANAQTISMNYPMPLDRMLARITPRAAVTDSIHKKSRPSVVRWFLGLFGPVTTDTRLATGSAYSRLTGTPSFWYLAGLSRDPGLKTDSTGRVQAAFGNQSNTSIDWGSTASTRLTTGYGSSISTTAEYGSRTGISNGSEQRSDHVRFPDIDVDYGRISDVLHFNRVLNNVRLRTAFGRTQQKDYLNSDTPTGITTSSEWRPLLGLSGDFKGGTRTELRIERRVTVAETRLFQDTFNTDRNTDINFSLARSYSQGQKVNILGKTSTVRTSVSLGLTAAYSKRSGDTRQVGVDGLASVTSSDRLSLNGTGSYGFSSNMTGNLEFGFLQDRNLQTAIVNRSVRIEVRGQLTF